MIKKIGLIGSLIILILSFVSTSIFNIYGNSVLQIILLLIISIYSYFIYLFDKKDYPIILYFLSLALLIHSSFISYYLWGWDINYEYSYVNNVLAHNYWDINYPFQINSMLTTVILLPIINLISNINLILIFKLLIPIIFAFVPVVIYSIYSKIFNRSIAIYASLFFIFTFVFYTEMLQLIRQQIAELILVLLLYVYFIKIEKKINKQYNILLLLLLTTLVFSHYAITYIYLFILVSAYIIYKVLNRYNIFKLNFNIPLSHIIFLIIFTNIWYTYTSSSINTNNIIEIIYNIYNYIISDLFNPNVTEALKLLITPQSTILQNISRYLDIYFQFMILLGIITIIIKYKKNINTFIIISFLNVSFLILNLIIPYLSNSLNTSRIYQIALLILSPYVIIGIIQFSKINSKLTKHCFKIISILLIIYFSLNNGLIYNIFGINSSFTLNNNVDYPIVTISDLSASDWIIQHNNEQNLYADTNRIYLFVSKQYTNITEIFNHIPINSTIYLSEYNVKNNEFSITLDQNVIQIKYNFNQINLNTIYSNKNSKILYIQKEIILFK